MGYTPSFTPQYENGWEDLPLETTPITAEALNAYDDAIVNVENYLATIDTEVKTNTTGQFNTITGGLLESCVITLEPVQSGSGTPSPSNVRPITGHSSVKVGNVGKNLIPMTVDAIKSTNPAGTWSGNTYTLRGCEVTINTDNDGNVISFTVNRVDTSTSNLVFYLVRDLVIAQESILNGCPSGGSDSTYRIRTGDADYDYGSGVTVQPKTTGIYIRVEASYNIQNVTFYPMLRVATETDATFEPYNGYTTTIALGQTVYGGSLDVVSGVLTVDRKYKYVNGSDTSFLSVASGQLQIAIDNDSITNTDSYHRTGKLICNRFVEIFNNSSSQEGIYYRANGSHNLLVRGNNYTAETTLSDWVTWLSSNPLQIVYWLATPFIIQLTPQQIETLIGQNNISVPLEGQSLDSLSYREMMAWDDVEKAVENYVEANPSGSSTGTLTKIKVGGTIYGVSGGGGSDVSITPTLSTGTKIADFEIDGVEGELYAPTGGGGNANIWTGTQAELEEVFDELEEGTQINITDDEQEVVEGGTIYSEEEQVIGLWLDKKPLYQKTCVVSETLAYNTWVDTGVDIPNAIVISAEAVLYQSDGNCYSVMANIGVDGSVYLLNVRNNPIDISSFTLKYTKSTDAPIDVTIGKSTMYIASSDCYSTEEKEIGCYTDGKPLYQKTMRFTSGWSLGYWVTLANLSSLSIERLVKTDGIFTRSSGGTTIQLSFNGSIFPESTNSVQYKVSVRYNNNGNLECLVLTYDDITYIDVTMQYTKTTDVAGSGQYTPASGKAVHYSTDEQVIGTWVDGSPVYKKTQIGGITFSAVSTWYDTDITGIDTIISVEGSIMRDDEPIPLGFFTSQINTTWTLRNNNIKLMMGAKNVGETYTLNNLTVIYTKVSS